MRFLWHRNQYIKLRGKFANDAGYNRLVRLGAGDCGEAKGQAFQVIGRVDRGNAVFFDAAEQFAHRATKTIRKPFSLQAR